jgi:hypothetical protein
VGDFVKYQILYLPTGEYIKNAFYDPKAKPCVYDTEEEAFKTVVSMCRLTQPLHLGFMSYNEIIFPSFYNHFDIVEFP